MQLQGKKVLVTGGKGFIGQHLVEKLLEEKMDVDVFDRKLKKDITDNSQLEKAIKKKYDVIFHLAGISGAVSSNEKRDEFLKINTLSSIKIAELILKYSPQTKLIVSSTRLEYGEPQYLPVDEKHPTLPTSVYGLSKLAFTQIAVGFFAKWGLDVVVLRTSNVYGPHNHTKFKGYNLVNYFIDLALNNSPIKLFGGGEQLRDYIYIDDFVNLLLEILKKDIKNEILNIGFGKGVSIKKMSEIVVNNVGKGKIIKEKWPEDYKLVETGSYISDTSKLKELLNFTPQISIAEGIDKTVNSNIKVISPQLGLDPNSMLGGEVFDRQILLGLTKNNVDVHIILPISLKHDKDQKWMMSYFPIVHFPASIFNILLFPFLIRAYIKKRFQIVRMHQPQYMWLSCWLLRLIFPNIKLVATYHKFEETDFLFLSKLLNNYWDRIFCDSENVKRQIINSYGVEAKKISVVHNGVPDYLRPEKKDSLILKKFKLNNKKVLLYMGLFIKRKNPMFLLDVLEKLVSLDKTYTLIMIGKGPQKNDLIKKAKKRKLNKNIRFIEPVFNEEKNKIINVADLFVFPSLDEGFALAPLEAMACGLGVIENNTHSASEAVENAKNGYLCKQEDVQDWVDKITKFYSNSKMKDKFKKNSLRKVNSEFKWDIAVKKHIEVFKEII